MVTGRWTSPSSPAFSRRWTVQLRRRVKAVSRVHQSLHLRGTGPCKRRQRRHSSMELTWTAAV